MIKKVLKKLFVVSLGFIVAAQSTFASDTDFQSPMYENHEIDLSFGFEVSGYDTKVYKEMDATAEPIYTIQKGDNLRVTNIIRIVATDKTFIKVSVNSAVDGFMTMCNPYASGNFLYKETINVFGQPVEVLTLDKSMNVHLSTELKSLPSDKDKTVYKVTDKDCLKFHKLHGITSDYGWVNITINGHTGWVPTKCVYADKGGPSLFTPEETIVWALIGHREI